MSISDVRPFQLLYVSELSSGASADVVGDIAVVSRQRNLACGISGALLFDGGRFCQLLEGAEPDVRLLMTRIEVDSRHCRLSISAASRFELPRLTTRWRSGYCSRRALDPLTAMPLAKDEVAIALFMSALASAVVV